MLNYLLATETAADSGWSQYLMLGIVAVLVVVIIVLYVFSNKKRKKQEQDAQDLINAVKPGNKVKTIGGICGIVVEVDNEENTFVLETGTEQSGKSYIKFDRQAIYQTDAVVEKKEEPKAETAAEITETAETSEVTAASETTVETAVTPDPEAVTVEPSEPAEVIDGAEPTVGEQEKPKPAPKNRNKKK